jgi:16S rRNA A1518/A1519 N6-dimethyltransferase RsmA/KsgA/DIM1 with predicted DNA glycosylase/AP lyase activity
MLRKLLAAFGAADSAYRAAGVEPTARAEELSLDQWITLANALRRPAT